MKFGAFETLSLNLLKTFCVFAEVGKVEETAQKLGITQASVSLQLKKLEEETGQVLFKTTGRKKLLSSFARDLFQSIAPPIKELELRLKEVSKTQLSVDQRILRIGCRHEIIKRLSPLIEFPGQVFISGMNSADALSALKSDEIDVAVLPNPQITGDWYSKKIFIDHPVLIANTKILKSKNWESLNLNFIKQPAVAYKKPAPFLNHVVEKLGGNPADLNIKFYCEDWISIIDTVKRKPSWSILPRTYDGMLEDVTSIVIPQKVLESSSIYAVYGKEWKGLPLFKITH